MKRALFILLLCLLGFNGVRASDPMYTATDSLFICRLLDEAAKNPKAKGSVLFFAKKFIGKPYAAHTLEINDDERLIVNTRQLDCTTFVESVTALVMCSRQGKASFCDYIEMLGNLRYRGGKVDGYTSRLHYFSDWISDNEIMGMVDEVQAPPEVFSSIQKLNVNYMSRHPEMYKALAAEPFLVKTIKGIEQGMAGKTVRYIPKERVGDVGNMRRVIRDGDIIAIATSIDDLDVSHVGFAVWHDNCLRLLHASSYYKKVVEDKILLYDYLRKRKSNIGIRVVRIK